MDISHKALFKQSSSLRETKLTFLNAWMMGQKVGIKSVEMKLVQPLSLRFTGRDRKPRKYIFHVLERF